MVAVAVANDSQRSALERRYGGRLEERLDWGRYVNYGTNRSEPVYGWFRFKEAFSRRLVHDVLSERWCLRAGSLVFDPFAGCGTTLLASSDLGYRAIGTDIMPISVFVTRVKLAYQTYHIPTLERAVTELLSKEPPPAKTAWPDVQIVDLAFPKRTRDRILAYREAILAYREEVRDFLMLGLLASLEEVSLTSKDGQFLRLVKRRPRSPRDVLERNFARMLADLRAIRLANGIRSGRSLARIFPGDARKLPGEIKRSQGQAAGIVTSPPYLNRYDYSRSYALELCLMYGEDGAPCVQEFGDLKAIRHSLLRSHIESRPAPTDLVRLPALEEALDRLAGKKLNNARIPIMIKGYFEDMNLAIKEMAQMLAPGGRVALVVANARFEGELIPVDLLLCELARRYGLETEEIVISRYKGNSSQQMGKYGKVPVRETISFWRKT